MRLCLREHLVVKCEVEEIELTTWDYDGKRHRVAGLCVYCPKCGNQAEVYGRSERSVRYAFWRFRLDCGDPLGGYYYQAE
jgi:hypothetical protein